ncbi:thiol:disulfide interchange protein DsbA/DsbL [Photobacterium gaetbulicola]|uniref:Thiol:disulfide interchange protein n=2 Tax=Photobacterium gaetbulicola TaxID=1295392 RepID=A0A0C5W686_9GAMM|nr:thiol:disulfide interchange protein DsbA/DsbL [Photobacterium gaetbulicola]AJR07031.1 putative thiol:disulfide interchange protein [Photobacterium gaetbulicola Gung47]KHT60694.1 thiol:disulfide interchange protein [Photobacterium gaetbulicola]PSU03711.1 thiol:disulfide interchange protein DsbA/DsbL [Photobacterium gaetbulicola]
MFKKILAFASVALLSLSVQAAKFTEGDYYKVLDLPKSSSPVVTEYFSFYCPHCNSFEPIIQQLKKNLPDNAKLQKNHVSFMGGAMGKSMSKAYATSVVLGVEDTMTPVLFARVHDMQKPPRNDDELRQIFLDEGVSAEDFDGAFNSFAVNSMVNRFNKAFQDSGLTGVPAIIVNNKYQVEAGKVKSIDEYFELVNYLLTK